MRAKRAVGLIVSIIFAAVGVSRADFQYTETSKMTGGSLLAMTKSLGVFSKSARQINEPQVTTTMVKGNRMRSEHADGTIQIIDLDNRRFININTANKTYSSMTFDEFKAALLQAQERAREEQAKAVAKHPESANIKITPKLHSEETGATKTILDQSTKELKMQIDMQFESTDPKVQQQAQSASMTMNTDSWIAPSVPGYDEMRQFYVRMAKELDWLPSTMGSMAGMNAQMGPAMQEFKKNMTTIKGMPLLQTISFGLAGTGVQQSQTAQATPPARQDSTDDQASVPTSTRDAITKGIGGAFGSFGRKKKKQEQEAQAQPDAGASSAAVPSNALMVMQVEVTQFSRTSVEKSLFDVPLGYAMVQADPNNVFGGRRK